MHKLKWMDGREGRDFSFCFPSIEASLDAGIDSESEEVARGDFRRGMMAVAWLVFGQDRGHCATQTYFFRDIGKRLQGRKTRPGSYCSTVQST